MSSITPFLVMGLFVSLNLIIIIWKYKHKRTLDATVDATLLVVVGFVFMGSQGALIMGTIGSFIVSIYLLFSPIQYSRSSHA